MKLNKVIMTALEWPVAWIQRLRDWLGAGATEVRLHPLDKHTYAMCEGGSKSRVVLGFASLRDAQDAHESIVRHAHDANTKDAQRLAILLDWWFGERPDLDFRKALSPDELIAMLDA
jgi:hypothetical protein